MRADTVACAVGSGRPADKSGSPVLLSPFPLPAEHRPRVSAHSLTRSCPRAGLPVATWWPSAVTSSSEESAHLEHRLHQGLWAARMLRCQGSGVSCSHPDTRELTASWQPLEALLWPNWPQGDQDFLLPTVPSCRGRVAMGGKRVLN